MNKIKIKKKNKQTFVSTTIVVIIPDSFMKRQTTPPICDRVTRSRSSSTSSTMSALEQINKKLEKLNQLDTICAEITEIKSTFRNIEKKQQENDLKITSNSDKISDLVKIVEELRSEVSQLQYSKVVNNIIVNGIPLKSDEVTNQIANELFTLILDSKIDSNIINSSRRMKLNNNISVPPLVICLSDNRIKTKIIKNWSEKRSTVAFQQKIRAHFALTTDDNINIAEEKTNFTNNLFKEARTQLKENYKFIWVKYGNLNIRKSESSPIIRIKNRSDLEKVVDKTKELQSASSSTDASN